MKRPLGVASSILYILLILSGLQSLPGLQAAYPERPVRIIVRLGVQTAPIIDPMVYA